jgi:nucleoside-diphosphate-sugar epimerase
MVSLGYAGLAKFGKITYLSSVAVYPSSSRSISEFEANPLTEYGHSKLEIEKKLTANLGESLTVLRVSNLYGANQVSKLESGIVRCIRDTNILKLPLSNVVRDFVHVRDLVAYFLSLGLGLPSGVYNFASGQPTSLIQFVNEWSVGFSLKWEASFEDPLILDSVINNSKFENTTNFTFTTLDVGIPLSRKALL